MRAFVELTHEPEPKTILLGYIVGTFKTEDFEGDVTASGKTLRVHVKGVKGHVDIDIRQAVGEAVAILIDGDMESMLLKGA